MSSFQENLNRLMLLKRVSAEELSRRTKISPSTISRYLSGEIKSARGDTLTAIAAALNTSPAILMGWESDDVDVNISRLVKAIRLNKKLSYDDVEVKSDYRIKTSEIEDLENENTGINYPNLIVFCKALRLDADRIISDSEARAEFAPELMESNFYDNLSEKEIESLTPSPEKENYKYFNDRSADNFYGANTLVLNDNTRGTLRAPLYQSLSCGTGLFVDDNIEEYITLPESLLKAKKEYFCQYADGDSMIEENILPGDLLVFEKTQNIENGQVGCFCIDDNMAICKKFYLDEASHIITLQPANSKYAPIIVTVESMNFHVVGKLSLVINKRD